ncbi:MAG TPA: serine hydrolase [Kofleriaceae bacterium]
MRVLSVVLARVLLLVSLATACGSGATTKPVQATSPPPAASPAPQKPVALAPPASTKATFPGLPDTVAGEHLAWILNAIANQDGVVTTADVEKRLHAKFLAAVPADQFVAVSKSLAALDPIVVKSVKGTELSLVAKLQTKQGPLLAIVEVDESTKQVVGLLFKPDSGDAPRPKTLPEAIQMTEAVAPQAQLLVASLDKGTCKPMLATKSKQPLAIGSTTKLYVLLGLVDKIRAGKAKWDDELAVRDDWKSLPSGITQNDAAGTKLTLKTFAERMISISDNTATDHLLYFVGRKAVEAALRATKHTAPARNTPFLSTRELFLFKLGMPDDEIERYRKLPEAKRRSYLDTTLAGKQADITKAADWTTARRIDQLEWFASADDLCRAMGTLWQRGQQDPAKPLLDVLGKNSGIELDKTTWPYIGFKGGSEPGVINLTWLVRRADDKWFVVVLTANAPAATVDESKVLGIAQGVFELLAKS